MFKFLHAADIHLDSPRAGLDPEDAPVDEIRQAPRQALKNLVKLAVDEAVNFVLIAGDLYDADWKDFRTGLFFIEQMSRLREAGIPAYLIRGNHDAENKMTKVLNLPDNVHLFEWRRAHTLHLEDCGVAIHGQSFSKADVRDDLSAKYPAAEKRMFNIGLLHTCATKTGKHERYAPCTLEGLKSRGYQYWALGHVHKREILHDDPHIVFPGNTQGRDIGETGSKGCFLVTVDDREKASLEFRSLDVYRWELCSVDVSESERPADVLKLVARRLEELARQGDGLPMAVRVELSGPTAAHAELAGDAKRWEHEIRGLAIQNGDGQLWIERVVRDTLPPPFADQTAFANGNVTDGPLAELMHFLGQVQQDDAALGELAAELDALQEKLPTELNGDALRLNEAAYVRAALDDVRHLLSARLARGTAA